MRFIVCLLFFFAALTHHAAAAPAMQEALDRLRDDWAVAKFMTPDKNMQKQKIVALEENAENIVAAYPQAAEPKIWLAVMLATDADLTRKMSDLKKLERVRALLEESMRIDPNALQGSAPVTLGALYYQLPGWPISFGNDKKAQQYFEQALAIDPEGMDSNFYYGQFLLDKHADADALELLRKALAAPPVPGYAVIERYRRIEIENAIAKAEKRLGRGR